MWKVPLFEINLGKEEIEAANAVFHSGWLTMGEITRSFERSFAEFINTRHAIAVSSGTAALHLANLAIGIGEGDEAICPSLTFVAGANSVLYSGGRPVFADISSKDNFNISPENIKSKITNQTKAIQIMHYAGYPCDMGRIREIADEYELKIIEDCAHALGAEYSGKKCGAIGDIGCFSFFSNKNMTTAEGGMVTTNDDRLAENIRLMRSHGMTSISLDRYQGHAFSYDVKCLGFNYRIDEIRSAIGIVQLKKLYDNNDKRRELVRVYRKRLKEVDGISVPFENNPGVSSCHIFPILLDKDVNRQKFMEYLKCKGIQTSIHYPAVHRFYFYRHNFKNNNYSLPLTEDIAEREVTLPLYPHMGKDAVWYICETILEYSQRGGYRQ